MRIKYIFTAVLSSLLLLSGCNNSSSNDVTSQNKTENTTVSETQAETQETVKRLVYEVDTNKPLIALTFDDGPNLTTTVEVLDKLEKYQVPASFFLVGNNITESTSKIAKRAFDMGCEIQNHSKAHNNMTEMTAEDIIADISYTSDKIKEITGVKPIFFRPPYIAVNDTMLQNIDMTFISGIGANDWDDNVSADARAEKILTQAKDGSIILLHDMQGNSKTVEALDTIIPKLLEEGYQFVTVSELFEAKGIDGMKNRYIFSNVLQTSMY